MYLETFTDDSGRIVVKVKLKPGSDSEQLMWCLMLLWIEKQFPSATIQVEG